MRKKDQGIQAQNIPDVVVLNLSIEEGIELLVYVIHWSDFMLRTVCYKK